MGKQTLKLLFWPVLFPSFLLSMGLGAVLPLQVIAALRLGANPALASALVAISGAAGLLCLVPMGSLIDRIGDRHAMAIATPYTAVLLLISALTLAFPGSWSLPVFVACLLLRAPGIIAWSLARQSAVAESVPINDRGKAMTALGGSQRVGMIAGPLLGSGLLIFFPLWLVFVVAAGITLLAIGMILSRRVSGTFDDVTKAAKKARSPEELSTSIRWGAVHLAGVAIAVLGLVRAASPVLIVLWGEHLGWKESQTTFLIAIGAVVKMLVMLPAGYLKDSLGRAPILAICLVVQASGYLCLSLFTTSPSLIFSVLIISLGNGLGAGINMTIGADLSPTVGRARFLSIWFIYTAVGQTGGPLIISGLLTFATLSTVMTALGLSAVAGAGWILGWQPRIGLPGRLPPRLTD